MSSFHEIQAQFQQFIFSGQSEINDSIVQTERVSINTRLGIYRNAYQLRLIECLTTSYPALHIYLGTEEFQKLCRSYIDAHPSRFRSIRWYGDHLSVFLKSYFTKDYGFLAELADFEWKMTLAFDGADDAVLKIEEMSIIPQESWAEIKFTPHSSAQIARYFWNSIPLWQALTQDSKLPDIKRFEDEISWIIWRSPDYMIQFYSLTKEESWALNAAFQGLSFGELCEGLCQWIAADEVGMTAASFLKNWIQNGILSRCDLLIKS